VPSWVLPVLVVAAISTLVFGGLILTAQGEDQAKVRVDAEGLVLEPAGWMRMWALSNGVTVPLANVVSVAAVDRSTLPLGIRAPGAYLPGVICAGTYRRRGSKGLWMVGKAKQVLDVELRDESYTRVVLQVADPVATAAAITSALGR